MTDTTMTRTKALIDKGRTWVKISGAYIETKVGK
jgi:hypothetical protein